MDIFNYLFCLVCFHRVFTLLFLAHYIVEAFAVRVNFCIILFCYYILLLLYVSEQSIPVICIFNYLFSFIVDGLLVGNSRR